MSLTAVILARDEERAIARAVGSVSFADEVLVVDACSVDRTVDIAKEAGARVITHPQSDFASQRAFAMSQVRTEWVLWIDADWMVPHAFGEQVRDAISTRGFAGFEVAIVNRFCGKILRRGGLFPEHRLRLHRVRGASWSGLVHEQVRIEGKIGRLTAPIEHVFAESLDARAHKTVRYAAALAEQWRRDGYRFRRRDLIVRPARRTLGKLFISGGIGDGVAGVIFWVMRGLESFLAVAMVWSAERRERAGVAA